MTLSEALAKLSELEKAMYALNHAQSVLYVDGDTAAPKNSWKGRGKALAYLAELEYRQLVNGETGEMLSVLLAHKGEIDEITFRKAEELKESGAEYLAATPWAAAEIICPGVQMPEGAFLSMEGLDGSGKSTQMERLTASLERFGFEVVHSREPGGTPISEKIREMLLDPANREMTDVTEALLYAAARAQHVREVIRPALASGKVLLCDRFLDSSVAYQGGGRMLGVDRVLEINAPAVEDTLPLLTVYLDLDHRTSLRRRSAASELDRMEAEKEEFHARVEAGYHELISRNPERYLVVDARGDREEIARQISEAVLARLMAAE